MKVKKIIFSFVLANFFTLAAQNAAVEPIKKALNFDTVEESISYLVKEADSAQSPCDKRVLFAFLGSVQEEASLFVDASSSFAKAAGIKVEQEVVNSFVLKKDATAAEKIVYSMLKKTSGVLVLDAVRCSLNVGDTKTALSYLNSSIRNSKNEKIQAKIKLYEVWAKLCDAESEKDLEESVVLLKAYSLMQSMESVKTSVLFTLWYVNNDKASAEELKKKYPLSQEAQIINGAVSIMPTPFWFFVPKKGNALVNIEDAKVNSIVQETKNSNVPQALQNSTLENEKAPEKENEKIKRQQVGLFGKRENADALVQRLKEKGFSAYIEEEKRPSGNIYFIVIVNENEKENMGLQLKTAGFDCYPIFN